MNQELVKTTDNKAVAQVNALASKMDKSVFDFSNTTALEIIQRYIRMLGDANCVPKKFRNRQTGAVNYGDILLVLDVMKNTGNTLAQCMNGLNPINGLLSPGAEWKKTQLDKSGRFYDDDYVEVGKPGTDSWGYYYQGIRKKDGHKCKGPTVTVKIAKDNGWWGKEGSLWPKDTENMLRKRALSRFVNDYAPDVSLNSVMDEDTKTIDAEIVDVTPSRFDKPLLTEESPSTPPPPPVKAKAETEKDLTNDVTLFEAKTADDYAQQDLDNQIGVALSELGSKLSTSQVKVLCEKNGLKYEEGLLNNEFQGLRTVLSHA